MKKTKSPIQAEDLNFIPMRETESFTQAIRAKKIFIAAEINGIWCYHSINTCPHDELTIAKELIDSSLHDI